MDSPIPQMPMSPGQSDPMMDPPKFSPPYPLWLIPVFIASLVWGFSTITINVVPDPALRRAIHWKLDKSESSSPLTRAELGQLTTLSVWDADLRSVHGMQHATQLRELKIKANRVDPECGMVYEGAKFDPAPLSDIPQLEVLDLSNNNFDFKDGAWLSQCEELRSLDLSNNALLTLTPLVGLPHLEVLRLGSCRIEDWSALSDMPALRELYLDDFYANIPYAELAECQQLRVLKIYGTGMPDVGEIDHQAGLLSLAKIQGLESLELSHLELRDVSPLHTMERLYDFKFTQEAKVEGLGEDWLRLLTQRRAAAKQRYRTDGSRFYDHRLDDH